MKKWIALFLIIGWMGSALEARVNLPESGRLAGPLNTLSSEVGEEFLNFPAILAPFPAGGGVPLTGWVEVVFGEPDGDEVDFTLNYHAVPSDGAFIFGAAQLYIVFAGEVVSIGDLSGGTLNLETGLVTDFQLNADVRNSVTSNLGRLNRIIPRLIGTYPAPDDFGTDIGTFPPGFFYTDVYFNTNSSGDITGFDFRGRTAFPIGAWAAANDDLEFFPPMAFAPGGTVLLHNPDLCLIPEVPVELCPNDDVNPDGIPFPSNALFHSHLILQSNELIEVPAERVIADCAPEGRTEGIVEAAAGKLYHISGIGAEGLSANVDVYDPATGTWTAGPAIPTPVHDAQATVVGDLIVVVGGRATIDGPAIATTQILDTATGTWSNGTDAPRAVARGGAETFGGAVYVLFGMTNDEMGSPEGDLVYSQALLLYGPEEDVWFEFGVPFPIEGFATVAAGPDIYMINGRTVLDGEEILSPFVFIFSALFNNIFFTSPTRVGIYEGAADIVENRLYLTGGVQEFDGGASNLTQTLELGRRVGVIDIFARSFWSPESNLPFQSTASGAAALNGEFYVIGGDTSGPGDLGPTNAVQQLNPARGWAVCDSQPLVSSNNILNTASLGFGLPFFTPGGQATLEGYNFGDEASSNDEATVPTTLSGISVMVDGQAAPILSVNPHRIDFQVPFGVNASGAPVSLVVTKDGSPAQADPIFFNALPTSPGIFVQSCGVTRDPFMLFTGQALACNADGTLNTNRNGARPGEDITIQMTGLGAVTAAPGNGERAPAGVATVVVPTITVTGEDGAPINAMVKSANLAEGQVGIYDVTITLPDDVREGTRVFVQADAGGVPSNIAAITVGEPVDPDPMDCMYDTDPDFRACYPEFSPLGN